LDHCGQDDRGWGPNANSYAPKKAMRLVISQVVGWEKPDPTTKASATTKEIIHPMSPRCRSCTSRLTRSLYGGDPDDPRGNEMGMDRDGSGSPRGQI
jgi:hypothetical protein